MLLLAWLVVGCGALAGPGSGTGAAGAVGSDTVVIGAGGLDGQHAPAFRLTDLQGKEVSLSQYAGRPVMVTFWASWCIPCQREFPMYRQAREQYAVQGLEVLGIVFEDTADDARRFMASEGAAWPALVDPGGSVARAYRVTAIPTTYFVDRSGVIRDASYGPPPQDALTTYIQQILQ
ncbi:MAG: TlpA family protein disulfide reductase [Candidatus Limnocylindrales bacterium]